MTRLRIGALCAVAVLLTAGVAAAQNGSVSGRVANARGGVVANAEVTLHLLPPPGQPAMPASHNMPGTTPDKTTTTSADGTFTFTGVPQGQYALMADSTGFERASQEVTVGTQAIQNVALSLEPLEIPGAEPLPASVAGSAAALSGCAQPPWPTTRLHTSGLFRKSSCTATLTLCSSLSAARAE